MDPIISRIFNQVDGINLNQVDDETSIRQLLVNFYRFIISNSTIFIFFSFIPLLRTFCQQVIIFSMQTMTRKKRTNNDPGNFIFNESYVYDAFF
jgi:hypothetical protein